MKTYREIEAEIERIDEAILEVVRKLDANQKEGKDVDGHKALACEKRVLHARLDALEWCRTALPEAIDEQPAPATA